MRVTSQRMQLCGALVLVLTATSMTLMSHNGFGLEVGISGCKENQLADPASTNDCSSTVQSNAAKEASKQSSTGQQEPSSVEGTTETNAGSGLTLVPCPPPPRTRGPAGIGADIKRLNNTCGEGSSTGAVPIAGSVDIQAEGNIPDTGVIADKERYVWVEGYINEAYVWGEVRVTRSGQVDGYVYRNGDRVQVQGAQQANDQIVATDAKGNSIALKLLP